MSRYETTQALGVALLLVGSALGGAAVLGATGVAAAQSQSASFVTVEDAVRVHAAEETEIRGGTSLDAGASVTVRAEGETADGPFIVTGETEVDENGEFAVPMNFAPYQPGSEFTVELVRNGSTLASADGKIVSESEPLYQSATETTDAGSSSGASTPGFGVGAALVALSAAAVLAGRRD